MTVRNALAQADKLRPNAVDEETKVSKRMRLAAEWISSEHATRIKAIEEGVQRSG